MVYVIERRYKGKEIVYTVADVWSIVPLLNMKYLTKKRMVKLVLEKKISIENIVVTKTGAVRGKYYSLDCILNYKDNKLIPRNSNDVTVLDIGANDIAIVLTLGEGQMKKYNLKQLLNMHAEKKINIVNIDSIEAMQKEVREPTADEHIEWLKKTVGDKNVAWTIQDFKDYMNYKGYTYKLSMNSYRPERSNDMLSDVSPKCKVVHIPCGVHIVQNLFSSLPSKDTKIIISDTVGYIDSIVRQNAESDQILQLGYIWFQSSKESAVNFMSLSALRNIEFAEECNLPMINCIANAYNNCKVSLKHSKYTAIIEKSFLNNSGSNVEIKVSGIRNCFVGGESNKYTVEFGKMTESLLNLRKSYIKFRAVYSNLVKNMWEKSTIDDSLLNLKSCVIRIRTGGIFNNALCNLSNCTIKYTNKYDIIANGIYGNCESVRIEGMPKGTGYVPCAYKVLIQNNTGFNKIVIEACREYMEYGTYEIQDNNVDIEYKLEKNEISTQMFNYKKSGGYNNILPNRHITFSGNTEDLALVGSTYSLLDEDTVKVLPDTVTCVYYSAIYNTPKFDSKDFPLVKKVVFDIDKMGSDVANNTLKIGQYGVLHTVILDSNITEVAFRCDIWNICNLVIGDGVKDLGDNTLSIIKSIYPIKRIFVVKGSSVDKIFRKNKIGAIRVDSVQSARDMLESDNKMTISKSKLRLLERNNSIIDELDKVTTNRNIYRAYKLVQIRLAIVNSTKLDIDVGNDEVELNKNKFKYTGKIFKPDISDENTCKYEDKHIPIANKIINAIMETFDYTEFPDEYIGTGTGAGAGAGTASIYGRALKSIAYNNVTMYEIDVAGLSWYILTIDDEVVYSMYLRNINNTSEVLINKGLMGTDFYGAGLYLRAGDTIAHAGDGSCALLDGDIIKSSVHASNIGAIVDGLPELGRHEVIRITNTESEMYSVAYHIDMITQLVFKEVYELKAITKYNIQRIVDVMTYKEYLKMIKRENTRNK